MRENIDSDERQVAAEDRRDNRRAIVVAVVGVLVVALASGVRMVAAEPSPQLAVPVPSPTATGKSVQLPTAAFHGNGTDGEHGDDTPLVKSPTPTPTPPPTQTSTPQP